MDKIAVDIGEIFFGGPHFLRDLTGAGQLVSIFLSNAIVVAGAVFVFLLVIAAITMISGAGDPQKFEQGRNIITAAIVGFVLVLAAYLIVRLISASLNNILN